MHKSVESAREGLSASELGHVDTAAPEQVPGYLLLPGDPNRVSKMAAQWDPGAREFTLNRGAKGAVGRYGGADLGAWSTGIGGPSAECVLTDLAAKGGHTFLRVGTTGAIQPHIRIGDIIINDAHVRLDGTSRLYVRDEFPAAASYEVVTALVQACETLGLRYHVGTGCTCASFYTGQCRTTYGGFRPQGLDDMLADLQGAGVLNFEMEGATVVTLSRLFGKRAAMCASVVANRVTGEWDETPQGEANACLAGAEALRLLSEWDRKKKTAGKRYFFPSL